MTLYPSYPTRPPIRAETAFFSLLFDLILMDRHPTKCQIHIHIK